MAGEGALIGGARRAFGGTRRALLRRGAGVSLLRFIHIHALFGIGLHESLIGRCRIGRLGLGESLVHAALQFRRAGLCLGEIITLRLLAGVKRIAGNGVFGGGAIPGLLIFRRGAGAQEPPYTGRDHHHRGCHHAGMQRLFDPGENAFFFLSRFAGIQMHRRTQGRRRHGGEIGLFARLLGSKAAVLME